MDEPSISTSRCPHCPRGGLPCRGEAIARLCQLVNPKHDAFNAAYRDILEPARNEANNPNNPFDRSTRDVGQIPLTESLRLTAMARNCPFRSQPACGCEAAAACALKGGADVSAQTCWDCVRRYGNS